MMVAPVPRPQSPYWTDVELRLLRALELALLKNDVSREADVRCALRVMRELYGERPPA
jgi:hypothetical protein